MAQIPDIVVKAMQEGIVASLQDGLNTLECRVCKQRASGSTSMMQHLKGTKHKESAAKYAIGNIHSAPRSLVSLLPPVIKNAAQKGVLVSHGGDVRCTTCSVVLTGTRQVQDHLIGQDHIKAGQVSQLQTLYDSVRETQDDQLKTDALRSGVVQQTSIATSPYFCKACNANITGEAPLMQHLKGNPHKKKVNASIGASNVHPVQLQPPLQPPPPLRLQLPPPLQLQQPRPIQHPPPSFLPSQDVSSIISEDEDELVNRALASGEIIETDKKSAPYACGPCSRSFNSRRTLLDHLKSHQHKKKQAHSAIIASAHSAITALEPSRQLSFGTYSVSSTPRGLVYVFNNQFLGQGLWERQGAEHDSRNLKTTFTDMGYEVKLYENLGKDHTDAAMKNIQQNSKLGRVDVLIIFILSHGKDPYTFHANDREEISLFNIRYLFTDQKCPAMKDKPKIFLTNYCRGNNMEKREYDSMEVPNDMATIHAAAEGVKAHRSASRGTYFVDNLCKVLKRNARELELRDIYNELRVTMKETNSTSPMWEDYGFKRFKFNPA